MYNIYNFTSTYTFIPVKVVWSVLQRSREGTTRPIVIVHETPNYLEAIANVIKRRREAGKDWVYKLVCHETNKPLDLNSQAVQANFK